MRRIVSRIVAALSGGFAALRWTARGRRATQSYTIVRANRPTRVTPVDHDDLLALRKELEFLRCCAKGESAKALTLLCQSGAFEDRDTAEYLRDTLREARAPQTIAAIRAIDEDHPRLGDEINAEEIAAKTRAFHRKVAQELAKVRGEVAESITAAYVKSTGLDAGVVEDLDDKPMSENKTGDEQNDSIQSAEAEADAILAEVGSQTGPPENRPDAASADADLDAIESLTDDEAGEPSTDEAADLQQSKNAGRATHESVDDALESVEDGIDALNNIVADTQGADEGAVSNDPTLDIGEGAADDVEALAESVLNEVGEAEPQSNSGPGASFGASNDKSSPAARAGSIPPPVNAGHPPVADRPSSGGRRLRPDRVTNAISDMGAFLMDEVAGLWSEARASIEHINQVRDQIDELHRGIYAVHCDLQARRNEVAAAAHEARRLKDQIQNIREDASRARRRADESAGDAQNAADRAASASREAESLARRAEGAWS